LKIKPKAKRMAENKNDFIIQILKDDR